jgi:hypothetical protein
MGIPPGVAAKLGIPNEVAKRVRAASLEANEALISLEAEVKRAQLDLERLLLEPAPHEAAAMNKLEVISKAELAVRKNRVALMLRVRGMLGPELWEKLLAELPPPPGAGRPPSPPPPPPPFPR